MNEGTPTQPDPPQQDPAAEPSEETTVLTVRTVKTNIIGTVGFEINHRPLNLPLKPHLSMVCMVVHVIARRFGITPEQALNGLAQVWLEMEAEAKAEMRAAQAAAGLKVRPN